MTLKYRVLLIVYKFIISTKNMKDETNEKKELIDYLSNLKNIFVTLMLLIFGGFIKYFIEKRI